MDNVEKICDLDIDLYRCVSQNIRTREVIITEERIAHIKGRHPDDYERFSAYIPRIIADPDYIIAANRPDTAVLLKEFMEYGERFKLILRLKTADLPTSYSNSVISFWCIGETTWNKMLKNKKILYKSE